MPPDTLRKVEELQSLVTERIRSFDEARYLDRIESLEQELEEVRNRRERIERLEAHVDRLGELLEGAIDVLIATHPDSHALYTALQRDAKTRLRLVRRHHESS